MPTDQPRPLTPLTPEEERELRARLAHSNGPDDDVGYSAFSDAEDAEWWSGKLLATLDAARSEARADGVRESNPTVDAALARFHSENGAGWWCLPDLAKPSVRGAHDMSDLTPNHNALAALDRANRALREALREAAMDALREAKATGNEPLTWENGVGVGVATMQRVIERRLSATPDTLGEGLDGLGADELVAGVASDLEYMAEDEGARLTERDRTIVDAAVRTTLTRLRERAALTARLREAGR